MLFALDFRPLWDFDSCKAPSSLSTGWFWYVLSRFLLMKRLFIGVYLVPRLDRLIVWFNDLFISWLFAKLYLSLTWDFRSFQSAHIVWILVVLMLLWTWRRAYYLMHIVVLSWVEVLFSYFIKSILLFLNRLVCQVW